MVLSLFFLFGACVPPVSRRAIKASVVQRKCNMTVWTSPLRGCEGLRKGVESGFGSTAQLVVLLLLGLDRENKT